MIVVVLFVCCDSFYKVLSGVECFDVDRDVWFYFGLWLVVVYFFCCVWGRMVYLVKLCLDECELVFFVLEIVWCFGGVFEYFEVLCFWVEVGLL